MTKVPPTFLHLNLTDRTFEVTSYEELIPEVGGVGWALALFEKFFEPDGEAPIVFATGLLSGVFPGVSKTAAVFRSPQSGRLAVSMGGGSLAKFTRFSGYQGLIVTGSSPDPVFVSVDEGEVEFKPAGFLTGLEVPKAFERAFSAEGVPSRRSVVLTGPAAEAGIGFGSLYIDEFFSFPRLGLGTAFAERNLKGIAVAGSGREEIRNPRRYEEVFGDLIKRLGGHGELSQFGTLKNLSVGNKISAVPKNNLSELGTVDERVLAGAFSDALASRRVSCAGCPVGCVHLLRLGKEFTPYEYEGVVALGPMLGIENPVEIGHLLKRAWAEGLDPASLGAVLAHLTEREGLKFGDFDTYTTLIAALVRGKEEWAKEFRNGLPADGTALSLGGTEFLPYLNGYASVLSQALELGATTEENRGFILDLDFLGKEWEPQEMVAGLVEAEEGKILSQLLVGCGYLSEIFEDPSTAFAGLEALESGFSHRELKEAARAAFRRKLALQRLLGFEPADAKIPEKFFAVNSPQGKLDEGVLWQALQIYAKEVFEPSD